MNNKEIIIEELNSRLKKTLYEAWGLGVSVSTGEMTEDTSNEKLDKFFKKIAILLLKKLNKLNKENLEEILITTFGYRYYPEMDSIRDRDINKAINQILQLVPEEGEVIAEAEIEKVFWIKDYNHLCFELGLDKCLWIKEEDFPSLGKYTLILKKSK